MVTEDNTIELNDDFKVALAFINETNRSVFVTGEAGTGKTTFLKYLKANTSKKTAVVAPTGIAAISASGVTVHSFFNLPIVPFLPGRSEVRNNLKAERRTLLRELELLIIDEVSMLRADILDAVDGILREVRKKPRLTFGGVQVLFIGDLYQLSPIVQPADWNQLNEFYETQYFISAKVFKKTDPVVINLKKIYRQKDDGLIKLLNAVRIGQCDTAQIQLLNTYCQSGLQGKDGYVTLSTHNSSVDSINTIKLSELPGVAVELSAEIRGDFDDASFPTEKVLQLKEGAQVMILRNDNSAEKRFFNGKIGVIQKIAQERLHIIFKDETLIELEREVWRNVKFEFDKASGKILEHEIGSFRQFPIRLAWAITIHKSQGLTFDRAILDMKNVFAPGQAYVALSRIRSLEGLILSDIVTKELINNNANVPMNLIEPDANSLIDILTAARKEYTKIIIAEKFEWIRLQSYIADQRPNLSGYEVLEVLHTKLISWTQISKKFDLEVNSLLGSAETNPYGKLDARVQAACSYFAKEINELLDDVLANEYKRTKNSVNQRMVFRFIKGFIDLLKTKRAELKSAATIIKGLNESKSITDIPSSSESTNFETEGVLSNVTRHNITELNEMQSVVLKYYRNGDSIATISQKTNLNIPSVENQLADLVGAGKLNILDIIEEGKLQQLIAIMQTDPSISIFMIKQKMGSNVSFGQIKAVLNYQKIARNNNVIT